MIKIAVRTNAEYWQIMNCLNDIGFKALCNFEDWSNIRIKHRMHFIGIGDKLYDLYMALDDTLLIWNDKVKSKAKTHFTGR
jgi:hypothetical protein